MTTYKDGLLRAALILRELAKAECALDERSVQSSIREDSYENAERTICAEAEQQPAPGMVMDKGPWHAGVTAVYSDDFTHDVHLTIHGDFADDNQREEYAKGLALMLNRTTQEAK
jgi:hypothetical protein